MWRQLPCVSMSIRNVPSSLNWTGGISDWRNFSTTSATPAESILDLFTTDEKKREKTYSTADKAEPTTALVQ